MVFEGFFPFDNLSAIFFVFSARSLRPCRGFFLGFLPGEGPVAGSSTSGGSARFFPLRSVVVAVVVVLMVSVMIKRRETDDEGRE